MRVIGSLQPRRPHAVAVRAAVRAAACASYVHMCVPLWRWRAHLMRLYDVHVALPELCLDLHAAVNSK